MRDATRGLIILALALSGAGRSTTSMLAQGIYRIEIVVERNEGPNWREIDPRLVLDRDDRLRFRLKAVSTAIFTLPIKAVRANTTSSFQEKVRRTGSRRTRNIHSLNPRVLSASPILQARKSYTSC